MSSTTVLSCQLTRCINDESLDILLVKVFPELTLECVYLLSPDKAIIWVKNGEIADAMVQKGKPIISMT